MAEMTCRERVMTACRRGVPDRIPRTMGFEHGFAKVVRENLKKEHRELDVDKLDFGKYYKIDPRHVGMNPTKKKVDFSKYFDRKDVEVGEWGCGRIWDESRHYAEYLYPLGKAEKISEIEEYPWPDWLEAYRYEGMADRVKALHAQGFPALGGPSSFFETAWQIRSMERLMEDMLLNEEMAFALYDKLMERNVRYARECALAGVDILYLGDDVAMQKGLMMSIPVWRKYLGRAMRATINAAREVKPDILVWYHSDGDIAPLVPDLIDVGLDILNPVQPECCDSAFLKKTYGNRLAFWGGLGVQSVLPFGKPEEVREHVRQQIATLGAGGGYVVAPSHVLERDTPWENFKAMVKAIDDFGKY